MNEQLLEELYSKYIFEDRQGIKSEWDKITEDYEEETGNELVFETARKKITPAIRERLWEAHLESQKPSLPPSELEIGGDGTRKLLAYKEMSEDQSKDPDEVMRINGYDPDEWDLIKLKVSEWTMGIENQNYSIGLEVRPKDKGELSIEDIIKVNEEYSYKHDKVKAKKIKSDRAIEIGITDTHIGSSAFEEDLYKEKIRKIRAHVDKEDIEEVFLVFYGDVLHVDNTNNTTARGTQLEVEDTAFSMFRQAKDVLNFTVAEFADLKLNVYWVQGNHARLTEYALFDGLNDSWSDNGHITFDTTEARRKAFLYGTQLVGLHHGDMPKKQQFDWLSRDFRKLWGQASFVEQHAGHVHHESVETKGAIKSRTLTTIKDTDGYEEGMGYRNISRVVQTFIYDKKEGLKQISYF